jgi:hypothetical protein
MSAEVINFTTRHCIHGADEPSRRRPRDLTTTAKNRRLRNERWEVWRKAAAATRYWWALLRLADELKIAEMNRLTYRTMPLNLCGEDRWAILESYRDALGAQLLAPAYDMASVN